MHFQHDLLRHVRDVCRLHWRNRGQSDVQIELLESRGLAYLRVSYAHGPWTKHELVGVCEGEPGHAVVEQLRGLAAGTEAELVFRGSDPSSETFDLAKASKIWLRPFEAYQRDLWDTTAYLRTQASLLADDPEYPLDLHVDKCWAPLGEPTPATQTALPAIMAWLATDGPRFVLVLGDFGTGKTFLLRTIARELSARDGLIPVIITMRDLEKGRTLDELLAQHMARHGEDPFHGAAFRHLLRMGKIALLFDGFDELALRTTYERVPQHFATLREAAAGAAKVIVTSRHQYFATDQAVRNALGDEVHRLSGSRIIRLFPLESAQRRELVMKTFDDDKAAEEFIDALREVPNLLDLATNPRMLAFMIRWYREGILTRKALAESAGTRMTTGKLYELLLTTWLEHEVRRQDLKGGLPALSVDQRMDALRATAVRMWRTGQRSLSLTDLGEVAEKISDLARLEMRPGEAEHTVGSSTVLVRTKDDDFAFIHQSVMEWFVAATAVAALADGTVHALLSDHEMTAPMVDFWCDLGDPGQIVAWARDVAGQAKAPGPSAKANAALVLQRRGAQATTVDFSGQDLRGRDLTSHNFADANLSGADLSGAVLPHDMQRANLRGARLVGARLGKADLTGARLSRADLTDARLVGADLTGASLNRTVLDRAVLIGATFDRDKLASCSLLGAALYSGDMAVQVAGRSAIRVLTPLRDNLLASGHDDGTIRIHDVVAGRTLRVWKAHTGRVTALHTVAGDSLASGGADGGVRVWDVTSGRVQTVFVDRGEEITALGRRVEVFAASSGQTIRLWNFITGELTGTYRTKDRVAALAFHRFPYLISASGDLELWPVDNAGPNAWETVGRGVSAVVTTTQDRAWTISESGVSAWDLTQRKWGTVLEGDFTAIAVSDHECVAVTDSEQVLLYAERSGVSQTVPTTRASRINALAIDKTTEWVAAGDDSGTVHVWQPRDGRLLAVLQTGAEPVTSLDMRSDRTLTSSTRSTATTEWQLNGLNSPKFTPSPVKLTAGVEAGNVTPPTVDSSKRWFAVAASDLFVTDLELHDRRSGGVVTLVGHQSWVRAMVFAPDSRWLASASADGQILIWDVGPRVVRRRRSPRLRLYSAHDVTVLAAFANPAWLITGGRSIVAWDPATGERTALFEWTGNPVTALIASPSTGLLIAGDSAGLVRAWDVHSQEIQFTVQTHAGEVRALALDPLERWFVSAGDDGVVKLWDMDVGGPLATLSSAEDGWIILLPDGHYKYGGNPANVWWAAGLCRFDAFELDELAPYLPGMTRIMPEDPLDLHG